MWQTQWLSLVSQDSGHVTVGRAVMQKSEVNKKGGEQRFSCQMWHVHNVTRAVPEIPRD